MIEKPDETGGSAEIGPAPWPVVDRSMINYDSPEATGQFPVPMGRPPHEEPGAGWRRVALVLTVLVLLIAVVAMLVFLVVL